MHYIIDCTALYSILYNTLYNIIYNTILCWKLFSLLRIQTKVLINIRLLIWISKHIFQKHLWKIRLLFLSQNIFITKETSYRKPLFWSAPKLNKSTATPTHMKHVDNTHRHVAYWVGGLDRQVEGGADTRWRRCVNTGHCNHIRSQCYPQTTAKSERSSPPQWAPSHRECEWGVSTARPRTCSWSWRDLRNRFSSCMI